MLRYILRRQGHTITEPDRICALEAMEKDCAGLPRAASPIEYLTVQDAPTCRVVRNYAACGEHRSFQRTSFEVIHGPMRPEAENTDVASSSM